MHIPGTAGQQERDVLYDASGTITAGGTAQIVLPEHKSRSFLLIQNLHASAAMYVEFGGARATATLTGTAITSFTITNAGFNYTKPPIVLLLGGGNSGNSAYLGCGAPGYPSPGDPAYAVPTVTDMSSQRPARATAVLGASGIAGSLISSITVNDGGAGFQVAPLVFLQNSLQDPFGVAIPSAGVGMLIPAGGSNIWVNGTFCPTDAVSIFCATSAAPFCIKYAP